MRLVNKAGGDANQRFVRRSLIDLHVNRIDRDFVNRPRFGGATRRADQEGVTSIAPVSEEASALRPNRPAARYNGRWPRAPPSSKLSRGRERQCGRLNVDGAAARRSVSGPG